jgi:hypothetical protein
MNKTRLITALTIPLIAMLVVVPGWNQIAAAPRPGPPPPRLTREGAPDRQIYIEKILGVLERKVADPTFRARAADKLTMLSDRQLQLMGALSERVAVVGDGPVDSIALFLLTALLILS